MVSIVRAKRAEYPLPPFCPPQKFPELAHRWPDQTLDADNEVYELVRNSWIQLALDREHLHTSSWNPLGTFIQPGDRVLIKPNLVFHKHPLGDQGLLSMMTHGSVIRPIVDYALLALQGKGHILIGDVALQSADWDVIMERTGLRALEQYYRDLTQNVSFLDLRPARALANRYGIVTKHEQLLGDPAGYVPVDLGRDSLLQPVMGQYQKLTITDYPQTAVSQHHNPDHNEYLIAGSALQANVVINVPKLKTHKKAGVTLAMKNLIGINGDKSWIAHHRQGTTAEGGDESPRLTGWDKFRYRTFVKLKYHRLGIPLLSAMIWTIEGLTKILNGMRPQTGQAPLSRLRRFQSITEGSWYGNDTLWRVILDLNRILLYADRSGKMQDRPQRRTFQVIDGILAGEYNGPMHQLPKNAGVIVAGTNPLLTDTVAAEFMGFDYRKIPQLRCGYEPMRWPLFVGSLASVQVTDQSVDNNFLDWQNIETLGFLPPVSWQGKIEHLRRPKNQAAPEIPSALNVATGE